MNPLVQTQLREVNRQIQALRAALAEQKTRLDETTAEREKILQQHWKERKEVATLQRIGQDYDALDAENQQLKSTMSQLNQRLRRVLSHVKALTAEFRP